MWIRLAVLIMYFIFLALMVIRGNKGKVIFGFGALVTLVLSPLSLFAIENGLYISELNTRSYETGAMMRILPYYIVFIICFFKFFKMPRKIKINNKRLFSFENSMLKIIPLITAALLVYAFLDVMISGAPIFNSDAPNKMNYFMETSKLPFMVQVYTYLALFSPIFLGMYFCKQKKNIKKASTLVLLVSTILYVVLIGFKSSGVQNILIGFVGPVIYLKTISGQLKLSAKRIFMIAGAGMIILASVVAINYGAYYGKGNIVDRFSERVLALGSHVWWRTDNYRFNKQLQVGEIAKNFADNVYAVATNTDVYDRKIGVAKIMNDLAPSEITNHYLGHKIRFATSFVATHVYDYGYFLTIIRVVLYAIFYAWLISRLMGHIISYDFVGVLLLYKIINAFETFLWGSGTVTEFLNYRILAVALIYVAYVFVCQRRVGAIGAKNE